jgi:ribosomal protein L11
VSIADVVKPALVEISIYPDKKVEVVIDQPTISILIFSK